MATDGFIQATRERPCAICAGTHWCTRSPDGAWCCMRVPSSRPAANGGWFHPGPGTDTSWQKPHPARQQARLPRMEDAAATPKAPLVVMGEGYGALLRLCPLSARHGSELRARGMSDAEIKARGYGSLQLRGRADVCRQMIMEGYELQGVPGFYVHEGGYYTLTGSPGLLIPVRDQQGEIQGLQIRVNDPGEGPRYMWMSSAGRPGGSSSGSPVHIAYPLGLVDDFRTWLTEGALKASLASDKLRAAIVGVAGVSGWRSGLDAAEKVGRKRAGLVVAFDMDAGENPHVKRHENDLIAAAWGAGWRVAVANWNPAFKGLDDALVAGQEITIEEARRHAP